ncbi:MAG: 16S rRNA (guanine(527)-N(7))-methyltransferase RsmG [Chloroflexota bacterium]
MAVRLDLRTAAKSLVGLQLTPQQVRAFERYARELLEWNRRFNLTAITDREEIDVKHFLDSLTCLLAMRGRALGRAIDVGTGAGFPGLPLKIACPGLRLTLVESVGKKVRFCRHVVEALGLEGVELIQARAEELGRQPAHRELYDWALARAVAPLPVLVEYLLPFLRIGGRAVAQKGETGPAEAHAAEKALRLLGGRVLQLIPLELPGVAEPRYLVVVEKTAATPSQYPRRLGIPSKRPLGGK